MATTPPSSRAFGGSLQQQQQQQQLMSSAVGMGGAGGGFDTPFTSESQALRMASEANIIQKRIEREIPEIAAQKKRAILNGRVYATVMAPNDASSMDLNSVTGADDAVSSNIDVPEVYGRGDLLIASAGVEFKNMNAMGMIESTGIIGIRQSTAFLLRLFEKNIGLVIGANNRMDYDAATMMKHADFTRLDEDYSEITSGYILPPDQSPNAPAKQTWTLEPRYIEGGARLQELLSSAPPASSTSAPGVAAAVATTATNLSKAIFGGGGPSSTTATGGGLSSTTGGIPRPRPKPNLPKPVLSSSSEVPSMATGGGISEEDKMAFSPVSPLVDWIDRVVVTRELLNTRINTIGDPGLGAFLSDAYLGTQGIQLSSVTFTIHGTRLLDPRQHPTLQRQTVEYTHHFLHVDIRCWADNMVPSILGSQYTRVAGKDIAMLNGYNEMSVLMILINALIYVYGNGRVPLSQSLVEILVNGEGLDKRLARIRHGSNSTMSTSVSSTLITPPSSPSSSSVRGGLRRGLAAATRASFSKEVALMEQMPSPPTRRRLSSASSRGPMIVQQSELISDTQVTTAGPTNRVLVHCAAGIGRTGVILTLIQYMSPFNPAPYSWLNIIRGMRGARKDMVMVSTQWKFLQYYTDMFAFNGHWITSSDPDMSPDELTQGSGILPEFYISYIMLGKPDAVGRFQERNELFSILLRIYFEELNAGARTTYGTRQEEAYIVYRLSLEVADAYRTTGVSREGAQRLMQIQAIMEARRRGPPSAAASPPASSSSSPFVISAPSSPAMSRSVSPIAMQMASSSSIKGGGGGGRDYISSVANLHQVIATYAPMAAAGGTESALAFPSSTRTPGSRAYAAGLHGPRSRISFGDLSDEEEEMMSSPPLESPFASPRMLGGGGGSTPYASITGLSSMPSLSTPPRSPTGSASSTPRSRSGKRRSPVSPPSSATATSSSSPSAKRPRPRTPPRRR